METNLRYCDYYSMMSLKDFVVFAAQVEAGTADANQHGISARTDLGSLA
jgi:hypothetical protein